MGKYFRKLAIVLLMLLAANKLAAQTNTWSMQRCVDYAIDNSIQIKQSKQNLDSKELSLNTSKWQWLPSVNANVSENYDVGRSPSKDGTIKDISSLNSSFNLNASVTLFSGLKNVYNRRAHESEYNSALEGLKSAKERITLNITTYYLKILYQKAILQIAEDQFALSEKQLATTRVMVENGKAPKSNLYQAEAQKEQDRITIIRAQNDVDMAILDLVQALELEVDSTFDIENVDIEQLIAAYADGLPSADEVYQKSLSLTPQLKEQQYMLESLRNNISVAKANYYPTVSLSASYSNAYYRYQDMDNVSFGDQINQNARKTIGLSVNIPIFNKLQSRNNVRSQRLAVTNQELAITDAQKSIYKEICTACANAQAASEVLKASVSSVLSAQKSYEYAQINYEVGKSTYIELDEIKSKYMQTLAQQVENQYDFVMKCKIIEYYMGEMGNQ